jgi:hypothetical protein
MRVAAVTCALTFVLLAGIFLPLQSRSQAKAEPSSPPKVQVWTSRTSGKDYRVRFNGDSILAEWINIPPRLQNPMIYARAELKKTGDMWKGATVTNFPCQVRAHGSPETRWCRLEGNIEITNIDKSSVLGRAEEWASFDCRKCEAKDPHMKFFIWVPKE